MVWFRWQFNYTYTLRGSVKTKAIFLSQDPAKPTLAIDTLVYEIANNAQNKLIAVKSNIYWRAKSNAFWIQLNNPLGLENDRLSISMLENTSKEVINSFVLQNNLTFVRKAITGWCDFQINDVSYDIFVKCNTMKTSNVNIINKIEIPTQGSYNTIPNDTSYATQWHLNKINAIGAWNIETGKPGILVGELGTGLENLLKNLKKILPDSRQVTIKVFEVEKVDLDATLLAELVAEQLEKRIAFRRAIREALQRAQKQNVNGIKIQVSGRLNGGEISRSEWIR